ncbi:MAG: membrane protein insertase YidC [Pseudomonadota bacterium]
MDNQRNLLLAVALSGLLILGWDVAMRQFYPEASISAPTDEVEPAAGTSAAGAPGTSVVAADLPEGTAPATGPVDLTATLADPQRVVIDAPRVAGSINLVGARIDDIVLKDHRQTIDDDSGPVRLFAPERTPDQYFAEFGFLANAERLTPDTVWTADEEKLTPDSPVTLTHTDANGLTYAITFSIDENYMIAASQTVSNTSENAAVIQPFSLINRTSANASADEFIVHSGPVGVFGGTIDEDYAYDDLDEVSKYTPDGAASWIGFTDRYWLSALVPGEGGTETSFRSLGNEIYRTDVIYDAVTLPAGQSISKTTRLFAGAKESALLDNYAETGIDDFGLAISWGWFWFIEKPLLALLKILFDFVGNFGVAIILLTVIIRGLLFPIAQKQFGSMAAMKAVQPKMKAIQDRYKDDKQKQQQEIMKLYKDEKVNPLAGCLPLLIQIPIFFALYKVLILAIEMRHKPLVDFWIQDLSAPDPWTILNLFGLLPFEVSGFLGIGVLAVLLGVTMWLTFKLNPSAMDPMQQQIFNFMPWILMFVMAPFAAGLLLYWVTSNILTLAQQSYLYSKHPQLRAAAEKEKADKAREATKEEQSKA